MAHTIAFRRLRKKYGMELHQDDVGIVFITIPYAGKLWHPQFSDSITFVSQRLADVFWFVDASLLQTFVTFQWAPNIVRVTLLLSSKIKQIQNVPFSMPGRAAWIWLAQSAWAFVRALFATLPSVCSFSNLGSSLFNFGSPLHVRGVLVKLIPSMGEG